MSGFIEKRLGEFQLENPKFQACPVRFYDVFGQQGHPIRCTISQMGPDMLARLLELNETQTGILHIVFKIADDNELLLLDMKDLRSMLDFVAKNAQKFTTQYGNITSQSIGAIQRSLLALENQGGDKFFGEPSFDIQDLLCSEGGKGVISVLAADKLMLQPKLYSTFMLWLMSELYSSLPEVGDMDLPKLVFFFDEAHMLFDGTSKAMVDKIEQVIRLIRSKGVGIYFISQSPSDIPDAILGQLGNRVQHALRAYTPKDKKTVKAAADSFRPNPAFNTEEAIQSLETGEALISFLDEKGAPSVVERCKVLFPLSQIGAINDSQRQDIIKKSRIYGKYDKSIDRESAFEVLLAQAEQQKIEEEKAKQEKEKEKEKAKQEKEKEKKSSKQSTTGKILGNAANTAARTAAREITKSILGTNKKSSKKSSSGGILGGFVRSILGNLLK